jgi:hypothetical protein
MLMQMGNNAHGFRPYAAFVYEGFLIFRNP